MQVIVTGKTFEHRKKLMELGGNWNNPSKQWTFVLPSDETVEQLRSLTGCIVTDNRIPTYSYSPKHETELHGDDLTYFNYFATKNPNSFFGFSSLETMTDFVENIQIPNDEQFGKMTDWRKFGRELGVSSDPRYLAWLTLPEWKKKTGTASMQEAIDLARYGWTDGLGSLADRFHIPHALGKRRTHSTAGGSVNVGRLLAGNPLHMKKRVHKPASRNLTVFVETVMWRGIQAENSMIRALIIAGLIDILETEGYRCEIIALKLCKTPLGCGGYQIACKLKEFGERLNLLDITFALGHPSFSRRFGFACEASTEANRETWRVAYIDQAFSEEYPCADNEIYFGQLTGSAQQKLISTNDPLSILPYILPDNFPIDIKVD